MPGKLELNRRFGRRHRLEICRWCGAREYEDCTTSCLSQFNRQRSGEFWDCVFQAKRMGIAAEWLQAQEQAKSYPVEWLAAARKELKAA
jgi:hypothetical protein